MKYRLSHIFEESIKFTYGSVVVDFFFCIPWSVVSFYTVSTSISNGLKIYEKLIIQMSYPNI